MSLIGRYLAKLHMRAPAIMGADQGSLARARRVAAELAVEYDYLEKTRLTPTKVLTKPKRLDVAGRDVVIIDDIISTGGTMVEAARVLKKQKARKIYAACTHPVLVNNAPKKISAAGVQKVIATDTIEHKTSTISVAPLIAGAIR
jgi:ribose-phosphate pyrophosphokinase